MVNRSRASTHLGIDLGTGSVKAAAFDDAGQPVAMASRAYAVTAPHPGWAESDPREWLDATIEVTSKVLADSGVLPQGVGFSGQMHGVVVVDEALEPLRPAILWADTRSSAEVGRLGRELGSDELSRLGSGPVAGFAATSLAWLASHEPEVLARARYVLQPKDWLRARLGGDIATDPSDASGTLMYDVVAGEWSPVVLDWLGLDGAVLPAVHGSTDAAGTITLGGAVIAAVVGGADTACALVGLGIEEGFIAVGSGAQVVRVLDEPSLDATLRTHTFARAGAVGAGWYRIGAVQSAGLALTAALAWLGASVDEANAALEQGVRDGDPIFVPYLSGERTPFMDPSLRGAWLGLSLATDRAAMLRSILEAVAQATALGVAAVQAAGPALPSVVPLVGGGTHAPAFRQLLADACGLSVAVAEAPNAAVAGAALLARGETSNPVPASLGEAVSPRAGVVDLLAARRDKMACYVTGTSN